MTLLIKKLIASLIMPLPLALILVGLGLLFIWSGRKRLASILISLSLAVVFFASWAPVADGLLMPLERKHPAADIGIVSATLKPDAIVVLGGGYVPELGLPVTSHINETTLVRLAEGLRLRHAIPELPLVLSGGSISGGPPSAHGYREVALALGVSLADLQVLDTPRDTREEAAAVRESLGEGARVVRVTSASHMPRAVQLFTSVGIDTIPAPTGHLVVQPRWDRWDYWVPSATNLRKTERAIYEYLGHVAAHWDL